MELLLIGAILLLASKSNAPAKPTLPAPEPKGQEGIDPVVRDWVNLVTDTLGKLK